MSLAGTVSVISAVETFISFYLITEFLGCDGCSFNGCLCRSSAQQETLLYVRFIVTRTEVLYFCLSLGIAVPNFDRIAYLECNCPQCPTYCAFLTDYYMRMTNEKKYYEASYVRAFYGNYAASFAYIP